MRIELRSPGAANAFFLGPPRQDGAGDRVLLERCVQCHAPCQATQRTSADACVGAIQHLACPEVAEDHISNL
jgi:hypothetical protein